MDKTTTDIMGKLGLLSRARAKRTATKDITYNRDGTVADVTMHCGACRRHYVYDGGKDIPLACPGCRIAGKWKIATRYLYH